ncbi:MAG: hypothetical protein ABSF90_01215 [Syntrophobacteraceae bacterium]|jgi:hypothetical protein
MDLLDIPSIEALRDRTAHSRLTQNQQSMSFCSRLTKKITTKNYSTAHGALIPLLIKPKGFVDINQNDERWFLE